MTATDTAGAALMALCANPEDEGMALHRSVLPGLAPRDAVATITPAIQPDGATREVMVLREATGSSFPMYITLEKSESSVWIPASWGRDYKLTFRTNGASETWFSFTDESGDSYLVTVARPRADHTVYYNSDRPAIKGVKGD